MKPANNRIIVNPYLSRKKQGSTTTNHGAARGPGGPPMTSKTPSDKAKQTSSSLSSSAPTTTTSKAKSYNTTARKPISTVAVHKSAKSDKTNVVRQPSKVATTEKGPLSTTALQRNPKTLKQKLKQDIENLKRAKALQKAKAEEKRRRRELEMLRAKAAAQGVATTTTTTGNPVSSPKPLVTPKPVVVSAEKAAPTGMGVDKKPTLGSTAFVVTTAPAPSVGPSNQGVAKESQPETTKSSSTLSNKDAPQAGSSVALDKNSTIKPESLSTTTGSPAAKPSALLPDNNASALLLPTDVTPKEESHSETLVDKGEKPEQAKSAVKETTPSPQERADEHDRTSTTLNNLTPTAKSPDPVPGSNPGTGSPSYPTLNNATPTANRVAAQGSHPSTGAPSVSSPPTSQTHQLNAATKHSPAVLSYQTPAPAYPTHQMLYCHGAAANNFYSAANPMTGVMQQPPPQWHNPWYSYLNMGQNLTTAYPAAHHHGYASPYTSSFGFSLPSHFPRPTFMYGTPQQFHAAIPVQQQQQPRAIPTTPRVPKPVPPKTVSKNILELPSPFAKTHELVKTQIVLLKPEVASTFGISVSLHSESALVEPEWLDRLNGLVHTPPTKSEKTELASTATTSTATLQPMITLVPESVGNEPTFSADSKAAQQRRRRRRRHVFSVMMVQCAEKQNKLGANRAIHLQKGDIILKVQGKDTHSLTFVEACKLFALPDTATKEDGWYRVNVVVARRRPPPPPKTVQPITLPVRVRSVTSADVSRWAWLRLKGLFTSKRVLGTAPNENELQDILANAGPSMADFSMSTLEQQWQKSVRELTRRMNAKAIEHWKAEWEKESPAIRETFDRSYLSLSTRSRMRSAARPANACKCSSKSHLFVNDPMCPLYSNLRRLGGLAEETDDDSTPTKPRKINKFQDRKLKVVEAAFAERVARQRHISNKEEAEASFVDQAEQLQLRELGQAIFSPSLTSIVISSIAALKAEFDRIKVQKTKMAEMVSNETKGASDTAKAAGKQHDACTSVDEEEEDDDDVPLVDLGKKRSLPAMQNSSSKKRKDDVIANVDLECLARILQYSSKRWGHVYREPGNGYAWRWELFHGQTGRQSWDASAQNPRKSLSLENVQFLFDDQVFKLLQFEGEPTTQEQIEAVTTLAFLADPSKTGVLDELLALYQSEVIRVDSFGVPRLSSSWYKNVDVLVLEEMMACWSREADPLGRYGMLESIPRILGSKWIRHDEGWALSSDPDDIIYDPDEFAEWRNAFETKQQEKSDDILGVGRFF